MKTTIERPVASASLVLVREGRRTPVKVELGQPYVVNAIEARCPASLEGLDAQPPDVCGSNTVQAVTLALRLLHGRLLDQLDKGHTLLDGDGIPLDRAGLDLLFSRGDWRRA